MNKAAEHKRWLAATGKLLEQAKFTVEQADALCTLAHAAADELEAVNADLKTSHAVGGVWDGSDPDAEAEHARIAALVETLRGAIASTRKAVGSRQGRRPAGARP
jgi:hypothetical protein